MKKPLSSQIKHQLPDYVVEEYPLFTQFMEAYYEWQEKNEGTTKILKSLPELQDVDTTQFGSTVFKLGAGTGDFIEDEIIYQGTSLPLALSKARVLSWNRLTKELRVKNIEANEAFQGFLPLLGDVRGAISGASYAYQSQTEFDESVDKFILWFRREFLTSIPEKALADPKILVKHIKEFYLARGTEKSYKFLFRILYNSDLDFYYPREDILKLSDGKWVQKYSIRVEATTGNPYDFIGKLIRGSVTNATAFVEEVKQFQSGPFIYYELFLNKGSIAGVFQPNEIVRAVDTTPLLEGRIYPIVTKIKITDEGTGYQVDDEVPIVGGGGSGAIARIAEVGTPLNNLLKIKIVNPGVGYTTAPIVDLVTPSNTQVGVAIAETSALFKYDGYYLNEDGKLSSNKYIHDGRYYQQFSYVLLVDQSLSTYRDIVKKLIHPAGLIFFGGFRSVNQVDMKPNVAVGLSGNAASWITLTRQQFNHDQDPLVLDYAPGYPGQRLPLYGGINMFSDIHIIPTVALGAQAFKLGPTYRSLEKHKFYYDPFEGSTANPDMLGANAGYYTQYGNCQIKDFADIVIGDVINQPQTPINIMPDPYLTNKGS